MVGVSQEYVFKNAIASVGESAVLEDQKGAKTQLYEYLLVIEKDQIVHVLGEYDWRFAIKTVQLTKSNDPGQNGFTYKYALPTDCLKLYTDFYQSNNNIRSSIYATRTKVYGQGVPLAFKVDGRYIHTNLETIQPITYKYLVNYPDMTLYFANVLIKKLAMQVALRVKPTLYAVMRDEYIFSLENAKSEDAKNGEIIARTGNILLQGNY